MSEKLPRTPLSTPLSGSARETERRIRGIFSGPKKRPPILLLALMCAACLLCGNLVSCRIAGAEADAPDRSQPEDVSSAGFPPVKDEDLPDGVKRVVLDGLNLDGAGGKDDSVTVISCGYPVKEEWTAVEVSLGDGRKLTWEYPYPCYPAVMAGYLTSTDHQCLVVELDDRTSNYGFAAYFVLEAELDTLVERAFLGGVNERALNSSGDSLGGGEIVQREDSPLELLRVPTLYHKWDDSLYGNLYWDGAAFVFQLDAIAPISSEPHPSEPDLDAEARQAYALALEG